MLAMIVTDAPSADPSRVEQPIGTIIAVHGLMESAETLGALAAHWSALGWRTVAVDLPGHGGSAALGPGTARAGDRIVDAVAQIADGIPGRLVIFGHSAGGSIAAAVAAIIASRAVPGAGGSEAVNRGPRLAGVILEDPYWLLPVSHRHDPHTAEAQVAWLKRAQALSEQERIAAHRTLWPGWDGAEFVPWARAITAVDPEVVRTGDYIPTRGWPDLLADLQAAAIPVLIVTGTDRIGILAEHRARAASFDARIAVIDGASHFVHRDAPDSFDTIVDDALAAAADN